MKEDVLQAYRMIARRLLRSRQCSPNLAAPKSITVFAVIMAPGFTSWLHLPVSVKDLVAATAGCIVGLGEEDRVAAEGLDRVLGVLQVVAHGDLALSNSQRSRGRGMSVRGVAAGAAGCVAAASGVDAAAERSAGIAVGVAAPAARLGVVATAAAGFAIEPMAMRGTTPPAA